MWSAVQVRGRRRPAGSGPFQAEADMNLDGVVNGLDVDPFVAAVVGGGLQAVPEPWTIALLALAGLALCFRPLC